jgi:hypothetical protein
MFNVWKHLALSHTVASQLIGYDHPRHILKAFQQPSKEPFGGFVIPSRLNEDVEHEAVLIHSTPTIVLRTLYPDEHLIKIPLVTGPRTTAAQAVGKALAKLLASASNGLIGHNDAPFGQQGFNIS